LLWRADADRDRPGRRPHPSLAGPPRPGLHRVRRHRGQTDGDERPRAGALRRLHHPVRVLRGVLLRDGAGVRPVEDGRADVVVGARRQSPGLGGHALVLLPRAPPPATHPRRLVGRGDRRGRPGRPHRSRGRRALVLRHRRHPRRDAAHAQAAGRRAVAPADADGRRALLHGRARRRIRALRRHRRVPDRGRRAAADADLRAGDPLHLVRDLLLRPHPDRGLVGHGRAGGMDRLRRQRAGGGGDARVLLPPTPRPRAPAGGGVGDGRQLSRRVTVARAPIKAVIFDAYGTLLKNEEMTLVPRRIVADHRLSAPVDDVLRQWIDLYSEAIQRPEFRTLREIQGDILQRVLRHFGVDADASPYVELFFQVTTRIELYPEVPDVMRA